MSDSVIKGSQASRKMRVSPGSKTAVIIGPEQAGGGLSQPQLSPSEVKKVADRKSQDLMMTTTGSRIQVNSLIFDVEWYRTEYPDVAAASLDPVRHYFDNGFREGRNPNRYFDTNWYASSNPDVAAAGLNPFLHYLLYGAREGRKPAP